MAVTATARAPGGSVALCCARWTASSRGAAAAFRCAADGFEEKQRACVRARARAWRSPPCFLARQTVQLDGCSRLTDAASLALAEHCRGITSVQMGGCDLLTTPDSIGLMLVE